MDITTLCYIEKDGKYLMLHRNKEENDMNKDKWISVGGHLEDNETIEECAIREVKEETGLTVKSLTYRAKLLFVNDDYSEIMHLFTINDFEGELIECDEGTLEWIKKEDILSLNIWEGDKEFLKVMQDTNDYFEMNMYYSKDKYIGFKRIK